MGSDTRFDRNVRLFGAAGQSKIEATHVAVAGVGGLGSHVVQQLAHLGVRKLSLIDSDVVEDSNLNRLIGAIPEDADQQRPKVEVARRVAQAIRPDAEIRMVFAPVDTPDAIQAVVTADIVFGCVDNDPARLLLTEITSRHGLAYIDLASDAGEDEGSVWYGGRIVVAHDGRRCLSCCGELDQRALALGSMTPEQRAANDAIYGIDRVLLGTAGPSVVSVNGVVASLAVTEFFALVTGLRAPVGQLAYYGHRGIVTTREDPRRIDCYYCSKLFGSAEAG